MQKALPRTLVLIVLQVISIVNFLSEKRIKGEYLLPIEEINRILDIILVLLLHTPIEG